MSTNGNKGFSIPIIMLMLLLIGVVTFFGRRIYLKNSSKNNSSSNTARSESQKNSDTYKYALELCKKEQKAAGVQSTFEECVNYHINIKRGLAINNLYSLLEKYRILNNGYPSEARINVLYPDGVVNVARS